MARVEIDESELVALQSVHRAVSSLMTHPEARQMVLEARKKVDPNAMIPELDAAKPIKDEMAKIRQEQSDFMKKIEDDRIARETTEKTNQFKASWETSKSRVRGDYPHFNDEALKAIEDMCVERGIADFEAGAALFAKKNPPPTPEAPSGFGSGWNFFDAPSQQGEDESMKKYIEAQMKSGGDDDRALDSMIRETLSDVRGTRRAA